MGRLLIILGLIFFVLTLISNYFDVNKFIFDNNAIENQILGSSNVTQVGHLWAYFSFESLQITESIISRYIDPCSSFEILNCSGFLWHPIISSILILPAGPTLAILSFVLIFFGLKKRKKQSIKKINN